MMNNACLPKMSADHLVAKRLAAGGVVLDLAKSEIRHPDGTRSELSTCQAALLACLARKAGTPVSRDEILEQVWKVDPRRMFTRTIDMHISLLRKKLGDLPEKPALLVTVHGVGYMLRSTAIFSDSIDALTTKSV
jgi:DNA-binding response OmpR family regulator